MTALPPFPDAAEAVPLSRMQKLVAMRMEQSWTTIPHVTHHDWADVEALEVWRAQRNSDGGGRVSALALYVKATAAALQLFPRLNANFDAKDGVLWQREPRHIGIAIALKDGLVVGVVRNCETRGAEEITTEIGRLSAKARASGLSYEEMSDGTFTISSLGPKGGEGFTPIVNPPQVAILGLGRLHERPVRTDGDSVAWRRMLPLSLSYDHRVIGGADAAQFLSGLREALQVLPAP